MVANLLLMQFQADLLDIDVVRPGVTETTALGAAYAAGLASGYWRGLDDLVANRNVAHRWRPAMAPERRAALIGSWRKAIDRSLGWTD